MNNLKVVKRDGRIKDFDEVRIKVAISRAYKDVYSDDSKFKDEYIFLEPMILNEINKVENNKINIEDIQDIIINCLKKINKEVALSYEKYRKERNLNREANSKTFNDIQAIFDMTSEEVRNNANKAGDKLQTYRAMISDVACGNYADARIIPEHILKEHGKSIYIHDKSYLPIPMFNCINVNWMDMLDNGFNMGSTHISTPNSITTAVAILSQIISHTTSNTYGGNTLGDLDIGLEKYIEKSYNKHCKIASKWIDDKEKQQEYAWERLEKEVYDAVQGLEYEITTLMNSRGKFCSTR